MRFCQHHHSWKHQGVWRCFSWSNQTLAMISLWVATAYLLREGRRRRASILTAVPAAFMSVVSMTCILMAKEGFSLSASAAYPVGIVFSVGCFAAYAVICARKAKG